jgi:soluble lytic murein transglycosylase-like protein
MRGIGATLSRLPAACALFAGAAILAGAPAGKAHAQPQAGADDIAMAIPRVAPRDLSGVALPQPLPPSAAIRIRNIFSLQSRGKIADAVREVSHLDLSVPLVRPILGHILADRYLGPYFRPAPEPLVEWLARWSDLPDAPAIHTLLVARLPKGHKPPPAPPNVALATEAAAPPIPEESEPADLSLTRIPAMDRSVWEAARSGRGAARRVLQRTRDLSPTYAGQLRGEAGQILFTLNQDEEAYEVAEAGVHLCANDPAKSPSDCPNAALAGFAAGLAAWRLDKPKVALPMFEAAWQAELSTSALRAAAAFWAARAHLRTHDPAGYVPWLARAAEERRTFYGMIARRVLGLGTGLLGGPPSETLGEADVEAVAATQPGQRAFALLQVGQQARAEAELRQLWPAAQSTPALGRAVMLVAAKAGLVHLAAQLADLVQTADGRPREATRFPIPRLRPAGGFKVEPPLLYALARTESDFNPRLKSSAGATGILQIMPDTASFLTGAPDNRALRGLLEDPAFNLDLGQRYLAYLAGIELTGGDMIRMLASYNCGPGSFARWAPSIQDNGDPFLFIESIPIDETRAYVPRVLTYSWIYETRTGQPTPTLDELAAGAWPRYHPPDTRQEPLARLH